MTTIIGSSPSSTLGLSLTSAIAYPTVLAAMYNNTAVGYKPVATSDVAKNVTVTALGAGASSIIWTPAAGKQILLMSLTIKTDVAGLYDLIFNVTTFKSITLPANVDTVIPLPPQGFALNLTSLNLSIKNNTAGAVNMQISAMGSEI